MTVRADSGLQDRTPIPLRLKVMEVRLKRRSTFRSHAIGRSSSPRTTIQGGRSGQVLTEVFAVLFMASAAILVVLCLRGPEKLEARSASQKLNEPVYGLSVHAPAQPGLVLQRNGSLQVRRIGETVPAGEVVYQGVVSPAFRQTENGCHFVARNILGQIESVECRAETVDGQLNYYPIGRQPLLSAFASIDLGCFSPDGRLAAISDGLQCVEVWDVRTAGLVTRIHGAKVDGLSFTQDSRQLLTLKSCREAQVWDMSTGQCSGTHPLDGRFSRTIACSLQAGCLIYGVFDSTGPVIATSLETGREIWSAEGHPLGTSCIVVSDENGLVASGGVDGIVRVYDVKSGKTLLELQTYSDAISNLQFTSGGNGLAVGDYEGHLVHYDLQILSEYLAGQPDERL